MHRLMPIYLLALGFHCKAQHIVDTLLYPRKVLIETFTGAKCGNCPAGLRMADSVRAHHPSGISLLSIHAGFYATTNATYTLDLTTPWGTAEDNYFGMSAAGSPNGLVDRQIFTGNSPILQPSNYENDASAIIFSGNSPVNIGIVALYNATTQQMNVDVELYFTSTTFAGSLLNVVLAEDSIWGKQLDYSLPGGGQVCYCKNNNVLRYSFTNQWDGVMVPSAASVAGNYYPQSFLYTIPSNMNVNNCHVIAYVSDTTSGRVIYTVEGRAVTVFSNIDGQVMERLNIYPNPVGDWLSLAGFEQGELVICNALGETVMSRKSQNAAEQVGIRELEVGIYFLYFTSERKRYSARFIKE